MVALALALAAVAPQLFWEILLASAALLVMELLVGPLEVLTLQPSLSLKV